jgi:hypothetical protein
MRLSTSPSKSQSKSPVKVRPVTQRPNGQRTLKLERRASEREPSTGSISATYTNGRDRYGLTHLQVVDRSEGGIGVLTRSELEPGMRITICPEGSRIPWLSALCVRCEPAGGKDDLYRVGLAYTPRRAA